MNENIIQGNPTKSFFIGMITRDISIRDAIIDLLDNSIDGANNIDPDNYDGLVVEININKDGFIVKDNCGGFSLETAQKYAFRFGRPDDAPKTGGSIGRFGVGMKRALFKIGQNFIVESKTDSDHFNVSVDVKEWKEKTITIKDKDGNTSEFDDWNFNYSLINGTASNLNKNGTYIHVSNLNTEVGSFFSDNGFLNDLQEDIERLLNFSLEKGLTIILNGVKLQKKGIEIFNDKSKPYFFETTFNNVKIKIFAGLSYVGDPNSSGWYIYCNDRLVVVAEKSEITGWGTLNIPRWHVDYVMFKGVVFLDSEETMDLPLTTTKKGIDATSEVFKKTLFYMREGMTSVLSFLKEIRKLDDANEYRKLLGEQEDKVTVHSLKKVVFEKIRTFIFPVIDYDVIAAKKEQVRISFSVPYILANNIKNKIGVKNFKEVGEYIFNYYVKMEEFSDE
ncbi:MAG: ATP-binding protein [Bacteroidia bacterium]|nr:ATP-binding protein [Bacteroidia bacterium]